MICIFFDGLGVLYHHAKFGVDLTTRVCCRCKNVVFVCLFLSRSEAGALFDQMPFSAFLERITLLDG